MTEKIFTFTDPDLISCESPCEKKFAVELVRKFKQKGKPDLHKTFRCVAPKTSLRGTHHPLQTGHTDNLAACRVCTIYTSLDGS